MIDGKRKWILKPKWSCCWPSMRMEQNAAEGQALPVCLGAQPYLMGTVKVTEPARVFDRDPEKLSRVIQWLSCGLLLFVTIFTCCMLGDLIFAPLGILDGWIFSYESFTPSPRGTASKLPQASPEHTTPPTFIWPT